MCYQLNYRVGQFHTIIGIIIALISIPLYGLNYQNHPIAQAVKSVIDNQDFRNQLNILLSQELMVLAKQNPDLVTQAKPLLQTLQKGLSLDWPTIQNQLGDYSTAVAAKNQEFASQLAIIDEHIKNASDADKAKYQQEKLNLLQKRDVAINALGKSPALTAYEQWALLVQKQAAPLIGDLYTMFSAENSSYWIHFCGDIITALLETLESVGKK